MQKFRFHSLALPHTISNTDYNACAYTQKIVKFSQMMMPRGHKIFHYGHEKSNLPCTEHITVTDDDVLNEAYGDHDWHRHQFKHNVTDYAHTTFVKNTIPEIIKRVKRNDFILCWWGYGHEPIAREAEKLGAIPVEPGIGYPSGHFAEWRAFESHAVRAVVEGDKNPQPWYSWVIPNYFNTSDFTYNENKSDYFLYLGRIADCKGVSVVVDATKKAGVKLKLAGQGSLVDLGYEKIPDHCEELGYADLDTRKELMSKAKALIIATSYLEPFGGVQVESLLSGTPVIAPFYGAFAEVLENNKTGFLCHTFREYVQAIKNIDSLNPQDCRNSGMRYSLEAVAPQFESWFASIYEVFNGKGWYSLDEKDYNKNYQEGVPTLGASS